MDSRETFDLDEPALTEADVKSSRINGVAESIFPSVVNKSIPGILSLLGSNLAHFGAILNLRSRDIFESLGEAVINVTSGAGFRAETRRRTVESGSDEDLVNLAPSQDILATTSGPEKEGVSAKVDATNSPDLPLPSEQHRQSPEL